MNISLITKSALNNEQPIKPMEHIITRTFQLISPSSPFDLRNDLGSPMSVTFYYTFVASEEDAEDPVAQRENGKTHSAEVLIYSMCIANAAFCEPEDFGKNWVVKGFLEGGEPGDRSLVLINLQSDDSTGDVTGLITFNPDQEHPELKVS